MPSDIFIKTAKGDVPAYFAAADDAKDAPTLIVIQEVWGMTPHIKDVAERFMREGYVVVAPDLIGPTGITKLVDQGVMAEMHNPATRDEAQKKMRAAMAPIQNPDFARDTIIRLEGVFQFLKNHPQGNGQVGVVGFCFGGTYAWNMAIHQPGLVAAVAFYGHAPIDENELGNISCPVLAFYGEKDERLMAQLPELEKTLNDLEKNFEAVVYPNCGHAFFNDTNPSTYNQNAAEDAWAKTLAFLKQSF